MTSLQRIIFLIVLIYSTSAFAQRFGKIYIDYTQAFSERDFDKQIRKGQDNKSIINSSKNISNDTLIYVVNNEVECFTTKMTFNHINEVQNRRIECDFQSYIFDCETCSKKHLADIISIYGFKENTEHTYLSFPTYKVEMEVHQETSRLILVFRKSELDRKSYKILYKYLKKKSVA